MKNLIDFPLNVIELAGGAGDRSESSHSSIVFTWYLNTSGGGVSAPEYTWKEWCLLIIVSVSDSCLHNSSTFAADLNNKHA